MKKWGKYIWPAAIAIAAIYLIKMGGKHNATLARLGAGL